MQQIFTVQAYSYYEAERQAKEKYGERVTILRQEAVKIPSGFLNLFSREGIRLTGIIPSLKMPQVNVPVQKTQQDFAEEKEKLLAMVNAGKDNALKEVLAEVRTIKEKLENQGGVKEEHPTIIRIDDILSQNDFPSSYRKAILERVRKEVTLEGLNNYNVVQNNVLEWIGESLKIYENDGFKVRPRIMVLVGPTGIGKSTTVVKLAVNYGIDENARHKHKRRIVIISIDGIKIGAKEQMGIYSDCMEYPFFFAKDYAGLRKIIAENSEGTDLFLIDTFGTSPRNSAQLGEMKMLLDACGTTADFHLVVEATTKSSDLTEILRYFEPFNYRSVIVTKLDETIRTGNVIGALSENGKPISYITDGQKVPADIKKASVIQFLTRLEGFKVNRVKLEERFPSSGRDLMQKWR